MNTNMDIETYMDMDTGDGHKVSTPGADIGKDMNMDTDIDKDNEHGR